ncbi:hypothetical protein ACWC5I_48795, partial [Kitasatospora sp. NPDC001574]
MSIQSITHVEYHCADADATAAGFCADYGFTSIPPEPGHLATAESQGARTLLLRQGGIRFLLRSATDPAHPVARYVDRHGEGVAALLDPLQQGGEPVGDGGAGAGGQVGEPPGLAL